VQLLDTRVVWLRVYVPETQYGRIRVGDAAQVRVDSFPGRIFRGRVAAISSQAEFTPKNVETREQRAQLVYWVKIRLPNADDALKPGMPADASIIVGKSG
jgi:HlyD family secretion protein